jgi:cellulose biosynthesis protein BcsQ
MSDMTVTPIESSMFALVGLTQLMRMVAAVRKAHAPRMIIMGLSTMHVSRQTVDKEVRAQMEAIFKTNVFDTRVKSVRGLTMKKSELKLLQERLQKAS